MVIMYKGNVTDMKKGIVQSIMEMYEQNKLLIYFDIQEGQFKVPYRHIESSIKRSDYDNVTELDLVNAYGIKGLYDRIRELDDNGNYYSEMTYSDLAYMFEKEVEIKVFNGIMYELNNNIQYNRINKVHDAQDLQSYVVLLADIENAINTLYNKYCRIY